MAFIDLKYRGLSCRLILFTTLSLAFEFQGTVEGAPQEIDRAAASPSAVYFGTEVVPILTKLGCNGGGCHGKAPGQNGFRLSLFGFEPEFDYEAIVKESRGRRLSLAAPDQSLLLAKATATMPHGGGRRLAVDSHDYQILRQWISQGAPAQ